MQTSAYQSVLRFPETSCPAHSDRYLQVLRTDTTLRGTAVSGVVFPILDIPSFQKLANDVQKTTVLDFPAQNINQFFVIDVIKTTLYIALDKPDHACEVRRNLTECGMTAFTRSETLGVAVKDRFIDSF